MPLDPSIPLQVQSFNPLQGYMQAQQMRDAQMKNALMQYQMQKAQEEEQRNNALTQAYQGVVRPDGTVDNATLLQRLSAGRAAGQIPAVQKQMLEAQEKQAKVTKEQTETAIKNLEFHRNALVGVNDPLAYAAWRTSLVQAEPRLAQIIPPQFSPQTKAQLLQTAEQLVQQMNMKLMEVRRGSTVDLVHPVTAEVKSSMPISESPDSIANRAVTVRGQNLADARAREALQFQKDKERGEKAEKAPANYRWKDGIPGGEVEPIPGGPADPRVKSDKPLTETQGNATAFAMRSREAADIMNELEAKGTLGRVSGAKEAMRQGMENVPWIGTGIANVAGGVANIVVSDAQQKYEQAKRNFISAVLRKESGAVISPTEFAEEDRKYFPQTGDGDAVIKQKRRARELAIEALKAQAGPGAQQIKPAKAAGTQGIKFLGFE